MAGQSLGSDYTQLDYGNDPGNKGLVIRRFMRRNGQAFNYAHDLLGRVTTVTPPSLTWQDVPIGYAYDNLGQVTQVTDTVYGHNAGYAYDALGRVVSESGPWSTKTMGYDMAGRLTYLGYGDGYWVNYQYDATGGVIAITEKGGSAQASTLASYAYDDLGRRTILARANGVTSYYNYGGSPWLQSLTLGYPNGANNQLYTFSYNAAAQIGNRTSSNDAYAWTQHYNVNRGYQANALNQYTQSGSVNPSYDLQGNLTNAGGPTYAYSARNLLIDAGSGNGFYYDALGRLDTEYGGSRALLDYTGDHVTTERDYNNGASVLRRYVYGPGSDEPLVWYEGSGTTDRRWLVADERGSVVAVTNGNGQPLAINAYDEYGIPQATNMGRFQYTGQAWIPTLGMYDYKARIYSPTLGRFLQTDPIGYSDGPNWYNYTHSDPVNGTDPTGLKLDSEYNKRNGGEPVAGDPGTGPNYDNSPFIDIMGQRASGTLPPGSIVTPNRFATSFEPSAVASPGVVGGQLPQSNPCSQMGTAMSPRQYANLGRQASLGNGSSTNSAGNSSNLLPLGRLASNLFDFRRNGPLDAEAHGSTKAYGNYTFGVYTRAAGFSLKETLDGADLFGRLFSSYDFNTNPADSYATHIPKVNADAIRAGYADGANASSCGRQ